MRKSVHVNSKFIRNETDFPGSAKRTTPRSGQGGCGATQSETRRGVWGVASVGERVGGDWQHARLELDLVCEGGMTAEGDDGVELLQGEVGHADVPAEALVDAGLQRCEPGAPGSASSPRFWAVGAKTFARNRTSPGLGVGDAGDESVAGGVHGRSALFGEGNAGVFQRDGRVHQVQVEVVQLQLRQRPLRRRGEKALRGVGRGGHSRRGRA